MILKLLYRTEENEYESMEFFLRPQGDAKDQSRDVVISLLSEGPPTEMWFRLEDRDTNEQIREMLEFTGLVRPHQGMNKFPRSKREQLQTILKYIEGDNE